MKVLMSSLKKLKSFLRKPEGFFAGTAIVFGGIFLLLLPPLQTPDEASHFLRAYQLSQFELTPIGHEGAVAGNLPKSLSKTIELLDTNPSLRFHPETKYDIHRTKAALNMPLNKGDKEFTTGVTSYSPVGYLPQAIGIFLGTLINLPPVALMYIARLASLVAWVGLLFMSIKIVPSKKWVFAGLGLLPMLIAQGLSPGIDAISVGLGVLFIALVLKMRTLPSISQKWWIALVVTACLIALTKQTTIIVLGFAFLLRAGQFDKEKWKAILKKYSVFVLPALVFIGWTLIIYAQNLGGTTQVEGQNGAGQVSNLLHHPFRFVQVTFNTFFTTWGDSVISSFVGNFGWLDTPLAGGFVSLGYIIIAGMLLINYETEKAKEKISRRQKWLIAILALAYVIGTCLALYVLYSPVDFNIIYGLQGRYFLLYLFILIPLFAGLQLKMPKKHFVTFVVAGSLFLLIISTLTLYIRYYITLFT
jgi:uncharacterized membrane protein